MTIKELEMARDLDKMGLNPKQLKLITAAVLSELAKIVGEGDLYSYQNTTDGREIDPYDTRTNIQKKLLRRSEEFLMSALSP